MLQKMTEGLDYVLIKITNKLEYRSWWVINFFSREDEQTIDKWIDQCFETVFLQIQSPDLTTVVCGLGQFELLYQFCRTFNHQSKYFKTKIFKKAFNMVPRVRHLFNTRISNDFYKELEEIRELKKYEWYEKYQSKN